MKMIVTLYEGMMTRETATDVVETKATLNWSSDGPSLRYYSRDIVYDDDAVTSGGQAIPVLMEIKLIHMLMVVGDFYWN